MGWEKGLLIALLFIVFLAQSVLASNGCNAADPECGSNPFNNCDIRQNTTLSPCTHGVGGGMDVCAHNITIDCNGSDFDVHDSVFTLYNISGVTLQNCIFNASLTPVFLTNSNFNTFINHNMRLPGNEHPLTYWSVNYSHGVKGINSNNNLFSGIFVNKRTYGIYINGNDNVFVNITLINNNLTGLHISGERNA